MPLQTFETQASELANAITLFNNAGAAQAVADEKVQAAVSAAASAADVVAGSREAALKELTDVENAIAELRNLLQEPPAQPVPLPVG